MMLYLIYMIVQYRNEARARADARIIAQPATVVANDIEYKLAA